MLLQLLEPGQLSPQSKEAVAVGIDLGTTHSVVAFVQGDEVVTVPVDGSPLVPSVVGWKDGTVVIGKDATIKNGLSSFKRFMNRPLEKLANGKTSVQLSAEVLNYLKHHAEKALGQTIQKAVITVPAYFDDTARQATRDAATLAGLSVLRLINEPTAAALSYGLDQASEGLYIIYDLGGGTFDVSLLKMSMGVFQVLATCGDIELGGDDIDEAIQRFWKETKGIVADKSTARKAKEFLSHNVSWQGEFLGQKLDLTEVQLNDLIDPFVQKTISICGRVLVDAGAVIHDIQGAVLVGGSTRLKSVREAVHAFFGKEPLINLDPDQVVARGAALQAHALTQGSDTLLLDVASLSLGIETMGNLTEKIIPRNTPIPTTIAQEFTTYQDGQTAMKIHVVQGEREFVSECRSLAEFVLTDIPPMVAGAARIQVTFDVDADGVLTVSAVEKTTNTSQRITVKPSYGLSHADLERMIYEGFEKGAEDIEKRLLVEAGVEASQLLQSLKTAMEADFDLLELEEKTSLEQGIKALEFSLRQGDRQKIKDHIKDLSLKSQPFAERRIGRSIQKRLVGKPVI